MGRTKNLHNWLPDVVNEFQKRRPSPKKMYDERSLEVEFRGMCFVTHSTHKRLHMIVKTRNVPLDKNWKNSDTGHREWFFSVSPLVEKPE